MLGVHTRVYIPGYTAPTPRPQCTPGYTVTCCSSAGRRGPGLKSGNNNEDKALGSLPVLLPVINARNLCAESFLSSLRTNVKDWMAIG